MGYKKGMLLMFIVLAVLIGLSEAFDFQEKDLESEKSLWDLYERWRSHHTVSRSLDDKYKRFNVFKHNVKHVHKVNKMDRPYKLKLNKFADLTNEEFRTSFAGSKISHHRMLQGEKTSPGFMYAHVDDIPTSIDWRMNGAVTSIKNQGNCGSCWAFSTIVAVEGINQIKTGKLVTLSVQELVDCDTSQNQGCSGGLMELAFQFIKKNGGISTEERYPYTGKDGDCNKAEMNAPVVSIDGYENVPENDENALLKAVANQPVSVAIDAGSQDLQFYSEGVFDGNCGTHLNHGVAAVGYGAAVDGTKYWVVKNSWGEEWGETGYIRLARDISDKEGKCGIAMEASYPIKLSSNNPPSSNAELLSKNDEL